MTKLLKLDGGDTYWTGDNDIEDCSSQHVPASGDWFVVTPVIDDDDNVEIHLEPVLAWRIHEGYVTAITVDGPVSDNEQYAYRRPDGTYVVQFDRDYADDASLIAAFQAELKDKEDRRLLKARVGAPGIASE